MRLRVAFLCLFVVLPVARAGSARAKVKPESVPVYARASETSPVLTRLARGAEVSIDLVISDSGGAWCGVSQGDPDAGLGWVRCVHLDRGQAGKGGELRLHSTAPSVPSNAPRDPIGEILDLSGITRQVESLTSPDSLKAAWKQLGPEMSAELGDVLAQTFHHDALYVPIRESLEAKATPERVAELLGWLRSPLSRKIIALELQATSPEVAAQLPDFARSLQNSPPSPNRLALVRRLEAAVNFSGTQMETTITVLRSMGKVLNPTLPPDKRLTDSMLSQMHAEYTPAMAQLTLLRLLFVYRTVPEQELAAYVGFWESPAGRWYSETIQKASIDAVGTATEDAMERLKGRLEKARTPARR